jgi:hypothetical protein
MRREAFEHVVAAAAEASGESELVVLGSQAILGSFPDAPASMLRSMEVDLYPLRLLEKTEEIEGSLGDGSWFHRTHGYYAHGVGPETATPPTGWQARLIRVEVPPRVASQRLAVAWCLEPHDLVLAKCVASRERDWEFAREALAHNLVDADVLLSRLDDLPVAEADRRRIWDRLDGIKRQLVSR